MAKSALCLAGLLLLGSPAAAQSNRQRSFPDPFAKAIDRNGDGVISAKEMAAAAESLRALDADGDDAIGRTEIRDAMRNAMRAMMSGRSGRSAPGMRTGASTLERAGLKLGRPIPDITIHDEKGGGFRFADVKGKYAVIVFGCLT